MHGGGYSTSNSEVERSGLDSVGNLDKRDHVGEDGGVSTSSDPWLLNWVGRLER